MADGSGTGLGESTLRWLSVFTVLSLSARRRCSCREEARQELGVTVKIKSRQSYLQSAAYHLHVIGRTIKTRDNQNRIGTAVQSPIWSWCLLVFFNYFAGVLHTQLWCKIIYFLDTVLAHIASLGWGIFQLDLFHAKKKMLPAKQCSWDASKRECKS